MRLLIVLLSIGLTLPVFAQHGVQTITSEQAAEQAEKARAAINAEVAEGLSLSLWASEDLVADPIALFIDNQGRAYITRTNRQKNSEFDIRGHRDWMIRSISFRTVEDRRAFLHEELAPERSDHNKWLKDLNGDGSHDWRDLTIEKDEVYRIEDRNGDGLADHSQRIVEDFNEEITDVAGAVLYHEDELFVGIGPDMWRLKDVDGDGAMDEKESISHGYAIHIGFGAHGMSGLTVGPDGRIYWGIGDIGFHGVDQTGKLWDYSNQGVIVRSNPDGSDFEVFAAGLRNTHEFVFDKYGNLISVDNDGDHPGEHERLVYIVNGSDSGWRTNWQFGKYTDPDNNRYNVWMDEDLFKPRWDGQAAHITPSIKLYHSGPTGMVYNPGMALGEAWKDHFFVSEFTGTPTRSHVYAFTLRPSGASFEFVDEKQILGGVLATGLEFGPDGALYAADWINGWGTKNKGRIWKLDVDEALMAEGRAEVQSLLGSGFGNKSDQALGELLQHEDMRIRQMAQFELAKRGKKGARVLETAVKQRIHQLARVHGIWGLGQLARQDRKYAKSLVMRLKDSDPEIRSQAAKTIGDVRYEPAAKSLIPLLQDPEPRPRFFAAEALGRIGYKDAVAPLIAMLETNNDEDAYLRHAGVLALVRIGDAAAVEALVNHESRALRIAAVVALRRMRHASAGKFLKDDDEYIVTEAARAINDDGAIESALPMLAQSLVDTPFTSEAFLRRAINANLVLGGAEEARRVAAFAARADAPPAMRQEAIAVLGIWPEPSVVDRVDGVYRGLLKRDKAIAINALSPVLPMLWVDTEHSVRVETAQSVGRLGHTPATASLDKLLRMDPVAEVRIAALNVLQKLGHEQMVDAVQAALADEDASVRMAGLAQVPGLSISPNRKVALLSSVFGLRTLEEQQHALIALGSMNEQSARKVLSEQLDVLIAGTIEPGIELELADAIEASGDVGLIERLAAYHAAKPETDPLAVYSESLAGGNAEAGERVFYRNQAAQCARCHNAGRGGGDVGPRLDTIGAQLSREEILQSLVEPSLRIAPGYGMVTLTFQDGSTVTGTLMEEDDQFIVVKSGESEPVKMAKTMIAKRQNAPSSMPPMGNILDKRELRDLVEFLSGLR